MRRRGATLLVALRIALVPISLLGRLLALPIRRHRERIRLLEEASGPDSPINQVQGLSDGSKRVYRYLASVILRFGSSHSKISTIARATGLSERKAREAIHELEGKRLIWHRERNTWHGRGAHEFHVRPVKLREQP